MKMKIAVSAEGSGLNSQADPRFGRAPFFIITEDGEHELKSIDNQLNRNSPNSAGVQAAQAVIDNGVDVVISGNCGPNAFRALSAAGINVFLFSGGTVQEALDKFRNGELEKLDGANVQGHW